MQGWVVGVARRNIIQQNRWANDKGMVRKNAGVWIDKQLSLYIHVSNIVSHCYKILKDIGSIKKFLERCHIEELVHAVIATRVDYCNSLLMNAGKNIIQKLQKLQKLCCTIGTRQEQALFCNLCS